MKKNLKRGIVLIVVSLIIGITLYSVSDQDNSEVILYEKVLVKKGDIKITTLANGKVSPRDEVQVKPQISGIISEILVNAGDYVEKGEIIAMVNVIPDISELSSAESRVRIAQIDLNKIEKEYKRQYTLFKEGVVTPEEMETSESNLNKAKEELINSEEILEIIKTGISKNTAQYSNTQIRATITGMILDISVKVGNSVIQANNFNDGTTIATIANMNDLLFVGKVDETEVGELYIGMPMELNIGAIKKQTFKANLEYISPKSIDENGATLFEIKASANIPNTILARAGYSASAEIILGQVKGTLIIPERTIEFQNDSSFVFVYDETLDNPDFVKTHISIGLSDGINIEVLSGLSQSDRIRGNVLKNN